jgi:hypothetical protein
MILPNGRIGINRLAASPAAALQVGAWLTTIQFGQDVEPENTPAD